jgi:hypothetical protein
VQGYFSFYEYAVSSWASHLEAGIAAANTKGLLDQLAESLEVFLDLHSSNHSNALVASKTLQDRLYPLKEFAFYTQVTQAIVSIRKELRRNGQGPSKDEPLDISMITTKVRRVLENLVSAARNPETELTLKIFYGPNLFKCPRINCQYFYKGFSNQGHRDQHVARRASLKAAQLQLLAVLLRRILQTICPTIMALKMIWIFPKSQLSQKESKIIHPPFNVIAAPKGLLELSIFGTI